jgi:cellulose synthase/poly-beta-1,6-N-acetylglucosamine synthase-like glycosyltransferase
MRECKPMLCRIDSSRKADRKLPESSVQVERVVGRWRLLLPATRTDESATRDATTRPAQELLAFGVANGHLPVTAPAASERLFADGEKFLEREAERIGLDESMPFEWADGERARAFEIEVPRNQARRLRVSGPAGLAWALFQPGTDGDWRSRSTASAVGFAAGVSQVKLGPGVCALVLFHDSAAAPAGPVEISFEDDGVKSVPVFLTDAHELRRFVLGTLVLAVALSLGEAGRVYLLTGDVWSTWVALPFGVLLLLFPASFAVNTLYHCFYSMPILRGEEGHRSASFANRPLQIEGMTWPSVTIQIPVFREPFEAVIRPTLESARKAAERYREKTGARCNVLVCDDGLLCFAGNDLQGALAAARSTPASARSTAQCELLARLAYYESADVAFAARPWPQAGVPGTERAGRFRKASNLNYTLRLADRLEPGEPLSEAHARFRTALPERAYTLGVAHGDVRVGEFIVLLDKDSVMPPDVIQATVPEFLADPTLAYTQHSTYPTNEDRYFSAMIGWFTRLLFDLAIRSKCLINGSMTPMLGHNLFLRRADLFRAGSWHEHSVCEDLEMMMRFHEGGRHGKYICYPGHDFGEAVTRVYTEELERFRRYAFGAAEAVIHPISEWERRGVVKESWRRFCRSQHVRWYQVVDLLQFFFSLINIATIVPFAVLTGLGVVHPYRALIMGVISIAIFNVVTFPAIYLLRRRGGMEAMPHNRMWRGRFGAWKAFVLQLALGISFIGYSLAVLRGALAHLLNRPLVFAETSVDALGQLSRRAHLRSGAMREAARDAVLLFVTAVLLVAWQFHLYSLPLPVGGEALDWRYHIVWLYPLVLVAAAPFAFHPYLVGGPDLPQWLAQRRRRAASQPPVVPPQIRKKTASRRKEAA